MHGAMTETKPVAHVKQPSFATTGTAKPSSIAKNISPKDSYEYQVIDKNEFLHAANNNAADNEQHPKQTNNETPSNWIPASLRVVPAFYPLEKSSRLVQDSVQAVARRVSDCCRQLSVHATYNNDTARLYTMDNVELHLVLWRTTNDDESVVVELQRRKGDSIAFHRYSRSLLDAAVGDNVPLDPTTYFDNLLYSRQVQRLVAVQHEHLQEHENAILAIEIAHGLVMKDRMDARQLGLESLCLLTDPRKTGYMTAVLAAHVVLLGTTSSVEISGVDKNDSDEAPFQEIRQAILGLVQFSKIGQEDESETATSADAQHLMLLHNLALAVLANALDVVEHADRFETADHEPEDTARPRGRLRTASSNDVANEFLQQTEDLHQKELLSTLISELSLADVKPHDATLSAKCLGSLVRASDEAKRRAQELGAKRVVSTALDVGVRTHLRLETECQRVVSVLERATSYVEAQQLHELEEEEDETNDAHHV
jgi:hypothetical protein